MMNSFRNVNKLKKRISIPREYDFEFINELPDDCVCKICHLALRKPVQTKCCGHRFCKDCLDEANRRLDVLLMVVRIFGALE
jgi:hypothetical protein